MLNFIVARFTVATTFPYVEGFFHWEPFLLLKFLTNLLNSSVVVPFALYYKSFEKIFFQTEMGTGFRAGIFLWKQQKTPTLRRRLVPAFLNGDPGGTRTPDPLIRSQIQNQKSSPGLDTPRYTAVILSSFIKNQYLFATNAIIQIGETWCQEYFSPQRAAGNSNGKTPIWCGKSLSQSSGG